MPDISFSLYENQKVFANKELTVDNYVGYIQNGFNQDLVINARAEKQRGNEAEYKRLKGLSMAITGSCIIESGKSKDAKNIKAMNGVIVIDIDTEIDEEKYYDLKNDKYTLIIHRSFGGDGVCIFVKIDPLKFSDSFHGLSEYYANTYDVAIDPSCSNVNRLRYVSFDPDIYYNPKSTKFIAKDVKRFKEVPAKETNYIFHEDDFDHILSQIQARAIDLCQEDYFRYVRIGMAIASKFGADGLDKFKFICSFGSKYKEKSAIRDYNGFVRRNKGQSTIGTFYYYCKEAGLEVYSEKTRTIINRVKVGKSQGKPTVGSIASNLKVANGIEVTPADMRLIGELIESKQDFSKEANLDVSEIQQIETFVLDSYSPTYDMISKNIILNNTLRMGDREFNDIYIRCKKNLDFKIPKDDIKAVLNSNSIPKINGVAAFFKDHEGETPSGFIEAYAGYIKPYNEYNVWAFRKWIVGAVHNWTSNDTNIEVSPVTLVLTGQEHGVGKTTWIRNILPPELRKYHTQEKLNSKDKDSVFRMCTSLVLYDDEFGGDGFKDIKAFKALSDMDFVIQRRPFATGDDTFKRLAMLCGSTNEIDILRDITGNRRILPINVEGIEYDNVLAMDKVSLLVEAYNLYQSGFQWRVRTKEEIDYIKANTSQNEVVLPIEEIFFKHFSLEPKGLYMKEVIYNQGDILEHLNNNSPMKPNKFEIKEVLTKNKLTYQAHRTDDGSVKKGVKLFVKFADTEEILPF